MGKNLLIGVVVFLVAFSLRCYDISYPPFQWMDEVRHVPAATNYWQNGQFETDNWEHPPLRHLMLYGFLQGFGDTPHGWRMRNVLFGALAAGLTALFAALVCDNRRIGLFAGLLLATDPLHIMLSRFTYEEVYGTALLLLSLVLFLKHGKRCGLLILSALFMGCALAVKWYVLPSILLLWVYCLAENNNYRDPGRLLFISTTWWLVPVGVFILSYYPWFGRGYSLPEFFEFITNAYYSLQADRPQHYDQAFFFVSHVLAREWFAMPVMVGQGALLGDGRGEFALFINNLPVWIFTLPAMVWMTLLAIRKRSRILLLPVLLFCSTYLLYLTVKRPVFLYSASTLLPFAFTALALCTVQLAEKFGSRVYYGVVAMTLAWNLYLYPLVTAKKVPVAAYWHLLRHADVRMPQG